MAEPLVFRTSATSAPFEDPLDQEVFLDCREHPDDAVVSQPLPSEPSSDESFNSLEVPAAPIFPRKWSSMDRVFDLRKEEEEKNGTLRRNRSHSEMAAWPTIRPEEEEEDEEDWEPDGFLQSDAESDEYETSEHSGEADDEFNDFLPPGSSSGGRMTLRSFRSFGDSLNLLHHHEDDDSDPAMQSSRSPSCSGSSPDASRSSPSSFLRRRCSRSAEVLSEDSGYGDPQAMGAEGGVASICRPDAAGPEGAVDDDNKKRTKRSPLSVAEAEEFVESELCIASGDAAAAPLSATRSLEFRASHTLAHNKLEEGLTGREDDDIRRLISPTAAAAASRRTDLAGAGAGSKFNWPEGDPLVPHLAQEKEEEEEKRGSCFTNGSEEEQQQQTLADAEQNVTCSIDMDSSAASAESSVFYPAHQQQVTLKRYGARQEVEVYITSSSSTSPVVQQQTIPAVRGVHFSPVVSAVNWRESYLDQSDDEIDDASTDPPPSSSGCNAPQQVSVAPSGGGVTVHKVVLGNQSPVLVSSQPLDGASAAAVVPPPVAEQPAQQQLASSNNNKKKSDGLFQRFSLARLSARMSQTFARADSKRASSKSLKNLKERPEASAAAVVVVEEQTDKPPPPPPPSKPAKRMRFFIGKRPFQRSASTPPEVEQTKLPPPAEAPLASPEPVVLVVQQQTPPTPPARHRSASPTTADSPRAAAAAATAQPDNGSSIPVSNFHPSNYVGHGGRRPIVVVAYFPAGIASFSEFNFLLFQIGKAMTLPASGSKPPLPPQLKPRLMARKNYLVHPVTLNPPPPVPSVTPAGLQHALQHFAESARMERERLANSVPDLIATPPPVPARPTSDCIDRSAGSSSPPPSSAPARPCPPSLPPRHPSSSSRERARQAALSRATSVETAWNATAQRAVLNLSRRNLSASGELFLQSSQSTTNQGQCGIFHFAPHATRHVTSFGRNAQVMVPDRQLPPGSRPDYSRRTWTKRRIWTS